MPTTDQIVVLAAGLGLRLGSAEAGVPKPLLEIGGVPLIAHALGHAEASGCRDAVVVIGHEGARVRHAIEALRTSLSVRFVETPDATAPNGHSLLAAAPLVRSRFFLQMVDHVFGQPVLSLLDRGSARPGEAARLLVDLLPDDSLDLMDATKVSLDGPRVTAIGKGIEPWDGVDTGCFALTPAVFDALLEVPASEPRTVSSAMRRLAGAGALYWTAIGDISWADVDTLADRATAERVFSGSSVRASLLT